ncbi:hypothetical protein ALQ20_03821 [Pseudomonas syringae pv. atrofaciens]|nr:hypothetical protein [Pseudomonas syringae]RMP53099.1 hypothetical protein ALQ20_03821 [Pseudomonas syringae pv. atrofaciens]
MLATDDPFHEAEQHPLQRGNWVVDGLENSGFLAEPTSVDHLSLIHI